VKPRRRRRSEAAESPDDVAGPLLAWYRRHRRDLPWRESRDPYRVWVSEIMLQQTQVERVRDFFARFMERFPEVADLAAAPERDVLKAWEGLGYYRRSSAAVRGNTPPWPATISLAAACSCRARR